MTEQWPNTGSGSVGPFNAPSVVTNSVESRIMKGLEPRILWE